MFKNYFTVAFRNFRRNKIFSLINILSLVIGISASLVIFLVVNYEFSFEKFQKDRDRIYRIVTNSVVSGKSYTSPGVPDPMGDAVRKELAGLDAVIPFRTWDDGARVTIQPANNIHPVVFKAQKKIAFVDEAYFDLLQYRWLAGSPATSMSEPYNVVLTESGARLYFPGLDVEAMTGREIYFNDTIRTTVAGVVKDLEQHTDFTFNTFISRPTLGAASLWPYESNDWNSTSSSSQLFVKLSPGTTRSQLSYQLEKLFNKYRKSDAGSIVQTTHLLQPLNDIHFSSDYDNFGQHPAHKPTLYGLLAIAAFLLILGCINFVNLTTARASRRAKEIGVRKSIGSSKRQLLSQFLSETFFLTLIASLLSVIALPLLLKAFSGFIPQGIYFSMVFQPYVLLFLLLLILVISLLSGAYPALVLSSFNPAVILKREGSSGAGSAGSGRLRKALTIFQFVIAQIFIIATILVSKQIRYSLNKDLGFNKDAILYFHTPFSDASAGNKFVLAEKLKAIPEVSMLSLSNNPPSASRNRNSIMKYRDGKTEIESNVDVKFADTNYTRLYGMKLVAGNTLPYSDTVNSLLINRTYARALGFQQPEEAVGKYIEWDNKRVPVVGVVEDFHQQSFYEKIRPLAIASSASQQTFLNVALRPQNAEGTAWKTALRKIESAWKDVYPNDDLEYAFLDETIAGYYKQEQDVSRLLAWATGLSIFISYLGLMGLIIYITVQRKKEIGIRKIVGASVAQIILLLLQEFFWLIIIASVVAIPVSWWGANKWLQHFAYRTGISWWVFVADLVIVLVITLLTLGAQIFKAANADPVRNIRTE